MPGICAADNHLPAVFFWRIPQDDWCFIVLPVCDQVTTGYKIPGSPQYRHCY
jgi:hypothetical protein